MCPRTRLIALAVLAIVCGGATHAQAFLASTHRSITVSLCLKTGLSQRFCDRVAIEAGNVDGEEWDDPAAHAQASSKLSLCQSANAVIARLAALRVELRGALASIAATPAKRWYDYYGQAARVATAAGRALHTLQDNRAHQGMGNPQHAWFSLGEACHTLTSPDSSQPALEAARGDTTTALRQLVAEITQAGVQQILASYSCDRAADNVPESGAGGEYPCAGVSSPTPWGACDFLAESKRWDGIDRRWNDSVTQPGFLEAFLGGTLRDMCQVKNLAHPPAAPVNIAGGPPKCVGMTIVCLGKVDDGGEAAAPVDAGCSFGGRAGSRVALLALAFLVAGLLLARRRAAR